MLIYRRFRPEERFVDRQPSHSLRGKDGHIDHSSSRLRARGLRVAGDGYALSIGYAHYQPKRPQNFVAIQLNRRRFSAKMRRCCRTKVAVFQETDFWRMPSFDVAVSFTLCLQSEMCAYVRTGTASESQLLPSPIQNGT